ncbi:MAG TPA: uracil-DNA glycosylase, partial [Gammaproteobacteria bacterium]|nr:uracil-DNA glycosylase [Gammaproteobacteria bacterium]
MNSQSLRYLKIMGITVWKQATDNTLSAEVQATCIDSGNLQDLQQQVAACTACALHTSRTQTVFGVGNSSADLMIIGEAPDLYEDQQGEPFVGKAGQLLNAMLQSIRLERKNVYIANILKCQTPNNRNPAPQELKQCSGFLNRQIELIQPKLILALGRIAAHHLLSTQQSLSELRGS